MFKKFFQKRKERKEQEDRELFDSLQAAQRRIFLRTLKNGQPKQRGRTRPPIRTSSTGPK